MCIRDRFRPDFLGRFMFARVVIILSSCLISVFFSEWRLYLREFIAQIEETGIRALAPMNVIWRRCSVRLCLCFNLFPRFLNVWWKALRYNPTQPFSHVHYLYCCPSQTADRISVVELSMLPICASKNSRYLLNCTGPFRDKAICRSDIKLPSCFFLSIALWRHCYLQDLKSD